MSNPIKDGGPAFPVPVLADEHGNFRSCHEWGTYMENGAGMSLRDWFAGQAPSEPQSWFSPVLLERPPDAWRVGERICTNHNYALEWAREHGGFVRNDNADAQVAYDRDIEKQRFVQWPYAWADAMISAREAKP